MAYSYHSSRLISLYNHLTFAWRIPFEPGHYLDILALLPVTALCVWLSVRLGGMTPDGLGTAARLGALIIGLHLFVITRRALQTGFNLQPGEFIFLPWLFWLVLDAAAFSPRNWLAEPALAMNIVAVAAFCSALYHLRHPWLPWLLGAPIALCACGVAGIALGIDVHFFAWFDGSVHVEDLIALTGLFGSPAGCAAALLLVLFPCLGAAFGGRWKVNQWQPWVAGALALVALVGIAATFHAGALAGLLAGATVLALLVLRQWPARASAIIAAGALAAFLSQFARHGQGSLLGTRADVTALLDTVIFCIRSNPIQGAGTGGFTEAFELFRPAGWSTSPATPGSLPLTILAEHGIAGTLLFFVPVLWLACTGVSRCWRRPWIETVDNPDERAGGYAAAEVARVAAGTDGSRRKRSKRRRNTASFRAPAPRLDPVRLRLGSALAGGAAAAVVLFTDYPCPMPAIACLFAVWGGLIMRDADIKTAFIRPTGLVPYVMRSVTFVLPAAFLLWSLAPIKSLKLSNRAGNALATLLPRIEDNTAPAPEPDKVAAGEKNLEAAEADALAAIRANPRNADAWNALACTQLCAAAAVPDPTGKLGHNALFAADKALELDSTNYVFVLTRAAALRAAGRPADAVVALEDAHRLAPWNINTLVSLATALARNPTNSPEQRGRERLLWETANKRYPNNKTIQRGLATATLLGAQQKK